MPLAHKLSSMIFIMPNHVEPLERVEKLLNKEQLKTWTAKMKKRSVAISLPKVVLEVSHDLQVKEVLEQLGLTVLWDGRNSGMVSNPCLLPLSLLHCVISGKVTDLLSPPRNTWVAWA